MSSRTAEKAVRAAEHWMSEVSKAAANFERRWTRRTLARVDNELAKRLAAQSQDFDRSLVIGDEADIEKQGAAMCRGYDVCRKALEGAQEPDDAYVLGWDRATGFKVAIGDQRAAADRVLELHGNSVVWVTPDEVASLFAGLEAFKSVLAVKRAFPGAEIIERYPGEPAQFDALPDPHPSQSREEGR